MTHFYQEIFGRSAWFLIGTNFFGPGYVAERCNMNVPELKKRVLAWDGKNPIIEHALFCAGGEIEVSLWDELLIEPSYKVCKGSYRYCKRPLPIRDLVEFLQQVVNGGDIHFGDFLCVEYIDETMFILAHSRSDGTHLFEVDENWPGSRTLVKTLQKKVVGFQGEMVISPLSRKILQSIVAEFEHVDGAQDYYRLVDKLNFWVSQFEYDYPFIKRCKELDPDFFYASRYAQL